MKRITAVISAFGLSAALGLSACGGASAPKKEVTAVSLLEDVEAYTKTLKSMESTLDMNIVMSGADLTSLNEEGTVTLTMDMDMQTTMDPTANHMTGTMHMMGMDMDMEIYTVLEDSEIVNYMNVLDQWSFQRLPYNKDEMSQLSASTEELLKHQDSLNLEEALEDTDAGKAYIVTGTIEGEDVRSILNEAENLVGDVAAVGESLGSLDGLVMNLRYAISEKDHRPVYSEFEFSGFEPMDEEIDMSVDSYTMRIDYKGFDTVDTITVPQEVKDSAQELTQ